MINFALFGQPSRDGEKTTIYLRVNFNSQKVRISTKITIPTKNWNQPAQSVVKGGDFDLPFYREKLSKIVSSVETTIRTANLENWELERTQAEIQKIFGKANAAPKKGVLTLYEEWAKYGTATKTNPAASDRLTYNVFKEFVNDKDLSFDSIDYQFYTDFIQHLRLTKQYKENTVGNHIRNLKAVMNEGMKRRLHTNTDFKGFSKPQEEITNINLTQAELDRLYKCKLDGINEKVRDVFVLGCYVAQRHSDYSRLSYKDIKDGYVIILQKKTGHRIRIPLHPIAKAILDKYNGVLPKISPQEFNEVLKHVARHHAKLTDKIMVRETKAGKKIDKYCEKWELVTSHTARKTGVTNALRAGVPMEDCMYLAGIKSPAVFKRYAGVTGDEYAERLANSKYFSGDAETEQLIEYAARIIRAGENPFWLQRLKGAFSASKRK